MNNKIDYAVIFAAAFVAGLLINFLHIGGLLVSIAVGVAVCLTFTLVLLAVRRRSRRPAA